MRVAAAAGRATAAALALLALAVAPAAAAIPRTSLAAIEQQVMCVTCGIPLAEADSPAAQQEKQFIQQLVFAGDSAAQIKRKLVAQYTTAVLALPPDKGFNVAFYLVPIGVVLAALALLALLLPRWRRNRARTAAIGTTGTLSAADRERLDAELARYDR